MTKKNNSKKVQQTIIETFGNALVARKGDRIFKAWREEDGSFILTAQDDGMPVSYTESHEEIGSLIASMREVADLRHWVSDKVGW